jgi:hypothetical protein
VSTCKPGMYHMILLIIFAAARRVYVQQQMHHGMIGSVASSD